MTAPALSFAPSGPPFDPDNPLSRPIDIPFMAGKLGRIIRFGAHPGALSVLQHQVMGAEAIVNEGGDHGTAALFLHHDDHEFILGDETTPMTGTKERRLPGYRKMLDAIKHDWDTAIYEALRLPPPSAWTPAQRNAVDRMDRRMMLAEGRALFGAAFRTEIDLKSPLRRTPLFSDRDLKARGGPLGCLWPPELAAERWFDAHQKFTGRSIR